jgi:hypothetical protein
MMTEFSTEEIPLSGGNLTAPVRIGNTVHRMTGPWSVAVHDLLHYLESRGFSGAPRFLGLDAQGREVLTFIEGEVGIYPLPTYMWADATLVAVARFLRSLHVVLADYAPPANAQWQAVYPDPARHEIICHNDVAPYNMIFVDQQPHALIDWDVAGPGPHLWDVAYAAYRFVPLSWAADIEALGLADPAAQSRRLRLFCDAYGLAARTEVLPMVEQRIQWLCDYLIAGAARGEPAIQKMVDKGHLAHYQRELAVFAAHRAALAQYL